MIDALIRAALAAGILRGTGDPKFVRDPDDGFWWLGEYDPADNRGARVVRRAVFTAEPPPADHALGDVPIFVVGPDIAEVTRYRWGAAEIALTYLATKALTPSSGPRSLRREVAHLVREITLLAEEYPDAREILAFEDHDWPDLDKVGLALGRVRSTVGERLGKRLDAGTPTGADSVLDVWVRVDDWNTVRSALQWLTGTD